MGSNFNETFSVDEVYTWLNDNGFQEFSEAFKEEGIDGEVMSCLSESALQSLVGRIGPRMKILRSIKGMQSYSLASSFRSDQINGTSSPSSSSWRDQDGDEASSEHSANGDRVYTPSRPRLSSNENLKTSKKRWTTPFPLPERFPPSVQDGLNGKTDLTKQARCKFIQSIYDRICLFTVFQQINVLLGTIHPFVRVLYKTRTTSPTPDQRRDVCRAIITNFPFLTDSSGGYEIWYRYLGDKIKNELRNERSDPVVLARKRKTSDGASKSPKIQAVIQRGVVNWEPPAVSGEDETTCKAHITWMQKEKKKRQPNIQLVEKKMSLTYSFRRKLVNGRQHLLKDVQEKYPFLFEKEQLRSEYNRLMAEDNASESFQEHLLQLAPKIIAVAERRGVKAEEAKKLLLLSRSSPSDMEEGELSGEDLVYIALCLLPYLLERKTKSAQNPELCLYQFGDDAKQVAESTRPGMAPFLIFSGTLTEPDQEVAIAGEGRVIMQPVSLLVAVESLMLLYYVCNLEYPKECFNTFLFIQRHVMKVYDTQKVPTKVLQLISELSKL